MSLDIYTFHRLLSYVNYNNACNVRFAKFSIIATQMPCMFDVYVCSLCETRSVIDTIFLFGLQLKANPPCLA
jgi:hypothetical protein